MWHISCIYYERSKGWLITHVVEECVVEECVVEDCIPVCKNCGSSMRVVSCSRGYTTYGCSQGCNDSYEFKYTEDPKT